jgi:hypothetical protein
LFSNKLKIAAASAEPPPKPAADGIFFSIVISNLGVIL